MNVIYIFFINYSPESLMRITSKGVAFAQCRRELFWTPALRKTVDETWEIWPAARANRVEGMKGMN